MTNEELNQSNIDNKSSQSELKTNKDSKGAENLEKDEKSINELIKSYAKETLALSDSRSKSLNDFISKMTINSTTGNTINSNIQKLKNEINLLDPSKVDFSIENNRSAFSFLNPVTKYFKKIKSQEAVIKSLLQDLENNKKILENDNITLEIECNKINDTITQLEVEIKTGEEYLNSYKSNISDDDKNNLEKKIYNIRQLIIVNKQSVLAMDVIKKNNSELINNIERIIGVTITSLNIAVLVANSLYNQKMVLKEIDIISKQTNNLNSNANGLLNTQSSKIANQISVAGLKKSFQDTFDLLEETRLEDNDHSKELKNEIIEIKINDESENNK